MKPMARCRRRPPKREATDPGRAGQGGIVGDTDHARFTRKVGAFGSDLSKPVTTAGDNRLDPAQGRDHHTPVGLLPAEPVLVGTAGGKYDRYRIITLDRHGDRSDRAAPAPRGTSQPLAQHPCEVGRVEGEARQSAPRARATSPVRTISSRPCGRSMLSKASILSCDPVTSTIRARRETSTIFARNISAN